MPTWKCQEPATYCLASRVAKWLQKDNKVLAVSTERSTKFIPLQMRFFLRNRLHCPIVRFDTISCKMAITWWLVNSLVATYSLFTSGCAGVGVHTLCSNDCSPLILPTHSNMDTSGFKTNQKLKIALTMKPVSRLEDGYDQTLIFT